MSDSPSEDDDGGIFCQSCSPTTRKIGYYATFLVGFIGFIWGFISSFAGDVAVLIISCLVILFCPLWIKSPKKCLIDFKNVLKVTSFLIFIAMLILTICCTAMEWGEVLQYILGIALAISAFWYFLTFFPNGQQAFIGCVKTCCGKESA